MTMKDKLEKNHHRAGYYRMKRFSVLTVALTSLVAAIVIPTYSMLNQNKTNISKAQTVEPIEDANSDGEVVNENTLLHY